MALNELGLVVGDEIKIKAPPSGGRSHYGLNATNFDFDAIHKVRDVDKISVSVENGNWFRNTEVVKVERPKLVVETVSISVETTQVKLRRVGEVVSLEITGKLSRQVVEDILNLTYGGE